MFSNGLTSGKTRGLCYVPGVSKGCCLEVFKYLRASQKHGTFVTPGSCLVLRSFWVLRILEESKICRGKGGSFLGDSQEDEDEATLNALEARGLCMVWLFAFGPGWARILYSSFVWDSVFLGIRKQPNFSDSKKCFLRKFEPAKALDSVRG